MENHTIKSIQEGIKRGDFSAHEIFDHYAIKIGRENKRLNAYLSTLVFQASVSGSQSQLAGVPCAIKDNILIDGTIATAGSKILENYISAYDASVITKLRNAGVQFLGKTNMDEFAMGTSTENSAFGPTKNPHNLERVTGGSSGGSAAAVAADLCVFALGSDTGGSVRQPASFCGVVGLKPTYGRVSRHGLIAMASSLDQIGPITKNVYDSALVLNSICGNDKFDSTTAPENAPDFTKNLDQDAAGLKIGVPREFFRKGLSLEVEDKIKATISRLEQMGCSIEEISLPNFEYALAAYYIIVPSEVSANLARFDGIRYGYSSEKSKILEDVYSESRSFGFGAEAKRRIMLGTYALSSGYYDAYYLKAQKVRALIKKDFDNAFRQVDAIVGPTAPSVAFKIGEKISDPLSLYLEDIYTVPINLAGLPAISIPCGNGAESNMPVGFQIIGNSFNEETVLRVAHQLEASFR
ncbi:MAG: Asp-tRNA(Asn)/Glu-tRNA(Gln) amidotransferase subunit GatA [Candidatus Yanofskybacteria bacterium]|nr:Asp-tRNA(Asn)/Glu-tRNA(Gln) amidotransferase subunit GatA [Candidatus Yanofskybacteria bacterium]